MLEFSLTLECSIFASPSLWSVLRTHLQSFQNSAQQSPGLLADCLESIPSLFPKGNCSAGAVSWHKEHGLSVAREQDVSLDAAGDP